MFTLQSDHSVLGSKSEWRAILGCLSGIEDTVTAPASTHIGLCTLTFSSAEAEPRSGLVLRSVERTAVGGMDYGVLGSNPLPLRLLFPKLTQYPPLPIPRGWMAIAFWCEALPRYGSLRGFAPRFPHRASDATPFNFTFCR